MRTAAHILFLPIDTSLVKINYNICERAVADNDYSSFIATALSLVLFNLNGSLYSQFILLFTGLERLNCFVLYGQAGLSLYLNSLSFARGLFLPTGLSGFGSYVLPLFIKGALL